MVAEEEQNLVEVHTVARAASCEAFELALPAKKSLHKDLSKNGLGRIFFFFFKASSK